MPENSCCGQSAVGDKSMNFPNWIDGIRRYLPPLRHRIQKENMLSPILAQIEYKYNPNFLKISRPEKLILSPAGCRSHQLFSLFCGISTVLPGASFKAAGWL